MNLKQMCDIAARYSDRADEFYLTETEEGSMEYQEEALLSFRIFRDAINEAYFEVARKRLLPDAFVKVETGIRGVIDLSALYPAVHTVVEVLDEPGETPMDFLFQTRFSLRVPDADAGKTVILHYHYLPDPLVTLWDEPVFPEAVVDPMVYISLAVARIWQSERKLNQYQVWMSEYYQKLRAVRPTMRDGRARRIPRGRTR